MPHPAAPTDPDVRRRGFTLVELIVVVLILGLLAAIAVVSFQHVTNQAHDARATSNLRQLQTATMAQSTLQGASTLSRPAMLSALNGHFPGGAAPGTTAADGWGLLRVDDQSPNGTTFAAGFDHGPGTVASNEPGSRAAVLLHSGSGKTIALVMTLGSGTQSSPTSCSGLVGATVTPRMVLAGADGEHCIAPGLQSPPTPAGVRITTTKTAEGMVLSWDEPVLVDVYRNGEWIGMGSGTSFTDPDGLPGDVYTVNVRVPGAPSHAPAPGGGSGTGTGGGGGGSSTIVTSGPYTSSTQATTLSWGTSTLPAGTTAVDIYRGSTLIGTASPTQGTWVDTAPTLGAVYTIVPMISGKPAPAVPVQASSTPKPVVPTSSAGSAPSLVLEDGAFTISWNGVPSSPTAPLTGYKVYRQPQGGEDWTARTQVWSGTQTSATDAPNFTTGNAWCYKVSAYGAGGESSLSAPACGTGQVAPASPSGLTVTRALSTLTLKWPAQTSTPNAPVTGYRLYRQSLDTGGAWTASTQIWTGTALTYTDTPPATPSKTYVYKLSSYGPGGESPLSASVRGALGTAPTAAPAGVSTAPGDKQVSLSWTAVAAANNGGAPILDYEVTISPAPAGGSAVQLVGSSATNFTVTGLTNFVQYSFQVRAVNGAGNGPASAPVSAFVGNTVSFTKNGQWTVPAGVTTVYADVRGASSAGAGSRAMVQMPVVPGQVYYAHVGYGGGAAGTTSVPVMSGSPGGGASDLRSAGDSLADRLVVSGGGGGSGGGSSNCDGGRGGAGGAAGTSASSGVGANGSQSNQGAGGGKGGTLTPGQSGSGTAGGAGRSAGGGGGGGYGGGSGGGGGNCSAGGGGGGSSYVNPALTILAWESFIGGASLTLTY